MIAHRIRRQRGVTVRSGPIAVGSTVESDVLQRWELAKRPTTVHTKKVPSTLRALIATTLLLTGCASILGADFDRPASRTGNDGGGSTASGDPADPDASQAGNAGTCPSGLADCNRGAQVCAPSKTELPRIPVVIEFLADQSGSMDSDGKWSAMRDALLATFEEMQTAAEPAILVGLIRYDVSVGRSVEPHALTAPGAHYDRLVTVIDTAGPGGGNSGVEAALKAGYEAVDEADIPVNSGLATDRMKRVVVLISDGPPSGATGKAETAHCEDLAFDAFNAQPPAGPLLTFAVGIGPFPSTTTAYDPGFMGRLAQNGGTGPVGCDPEATDVAAACHFQVTPQGTSVTTALLKEAIDEIRAQSAPCELRFTLGTPVGGVQVVVTTKDGKAMPIAKDDKNGWSFDDPANPTKVILRGDACSASNGTRSGRVDFIAGCAADGGT